MNIVEKARQKLLLQTDLSQEEYEAIRLSNSATSILALHDEHFGGNLSRISPAALAEIFVESEAADVPDYNDNEVEGFETFPLTSDGL